MVELLKLVAYDVDFDDIGNQQEKEIIRPTYCEVLNITMAEFYRAKEQKIGIKYCLKINSFDYQGEKHVIFRGKKYKVHRTYSKNDKMELYVGD